MHVRCHNGDNLYPELCELAHSPFQTQVILSTVAISAGCIDTPIVKCDAGHTIWTVDTSQGVQRLHELQKVYYNKIILAVA